ncbi:uncharacterized protein [Nicotiana tomentosiformis]|uniref:uncharacterized protein n=1 Tax=Nicotiana tomentosiformis TaxID=4098 RepID=UPI00388CB538
MAQYEALYGRKYRSPIGWFEDGETNLLGPDLVQEAIDKVLETPTILLDEKLSYEEEPMAIVDRQVRKLWSKEILFVNVLWRNHTVEESTWEVEKDMQTKYPHLFQLTGNT